MRVISQKLLKEFWERHPNSERALRDWFKTAVAAQWRSLIEVRRTYRHADAVDTGVGMLTVFNVCGNKYRLIVRIRYDWGLINVQRVLTHQEYTTDKWKA